MKNHVLYLSFFVLMAFCLTSSSCKKEKDPRVPPGVSFKTDAGYTADDATVDVGDTLKVGVIATKKEDKLNTFNVSYAYDGGASTTKTNENILGSEEEGFTRDVTIIARNQPGTEKWIFTVSDLDGNITTESITLTVK